MKWQKIPNLFLSIVAGLLLWISWPPGVLFPFIFISFIPFFLIERNLSKKNYKRTGWIFFGFVFLGMLVWNVLTTYWIWFATASANAEPASIAAWVLNALFMSIPWVGYYRIKKRYDLRMAFIAFLCFWLCFEWIHFSWELSWPWLSLGNVFAKFPQLVQWYELTGVSGGTLWVLLVNVFLYKLLVLKINYRRANLIVLLALLVLPLSYSIIRFNTYEEKEEKINVNIIQPNIDPYALKDNEVSSNEVLQQLLRLSTEKSDSTTDYIVLPEGALPSFQWRNNIDQDAFVRALAKVFGQAPNAKIIAGTDILENYGAQEKTSTARYSERGRFYYDVYNAAIQIEKDRSSLFYGKSKLVPGVERIPYPKYTRFLSDFAIDLGGAAGSRATQKERVVFPSKQATVAPAICYESIFGDYVNEFVKNGADVLFIITNDGWWKDTPGYKQHLHYARLRAIENRRSVARSANTGISAFINQRGEILQQTQWWQEDSIVGSIQSNHKVTFYTRFGDVFYRIGAFMTVVFILISLVKRWTNNFKYRN